MTDMYQRTIPAVDAEFVPHNVLSMNEPHLACILLLDTSSSMGIPDKENGLCPIDNLNKAIISFKNNIMQDEIARRRVDVAIVSFDSNVSVVQDFTPICRMETPTLKASGWTSMNNGILTAIDMVKKRDVLYASLGTPCFKPWIVMITDGEPTEDITEARNMIAFEESKGKHGKLSFWSVGAPGYTRKIVSTLSKRCIELSDNTFVNFFDWLADSMSVISVSNVGEQITLRELPSNAHIIPSNWY